MTLYPKQHTAGRVRATPCRMYMPLQRFNAIIVSLILVRFVLSLLLTRASATCINRVFFGIPNTTLDKQSMEAKRFHKRLLFFTYYVTYIMMRLPSLFLLLLIASITIHCNDESRLTPSQPDEVDYRISMSTVTPSILESGGSANLTITLDQTNEGNVIPFELVMSGTATFGEDFEITDTRNIAEGEQSVIITIRMINDTEVEGNETIVISLQENVDNVGKGDSVVTIQILDDDMDQQPTCTNTSDTYAIVLDPSGCTVDIETVLGVSSDYREQTMGGDRVITTNAIPNHQVGQFPNMGNPNTITVQDVSYTITMSPATNNRATALTTSNGAPRYRFGILFNGILLAPIAAEFFTNTQTGNDNTDWNENALSSAIRLGTDCNNAHVFPNGMYHHHATPSAFIDSENIDGTTPVQIGWAADGYPIYYKYGNKGGAVVALEDSYQLKQQERGGDGVSAPEGCPDGTYTQDYEYIANLGDLDECNGYQDPQLGYIYIMTDTYPSIPRCFMGTPNNSFTN